MYSQPFAKEHLEWLFEFQSNKQNTLLRRESSVLEFKESFSLGSLPKYLKTIAGFANNKGGYIVFGVREKPHILLGLRDDRFSDADTEKITQFFHENLSQEVEGEKFEHTIKNKTIGILYVSESKKKPVITIKQSGDIYKAGEIFYRYGGRTDRIKPAELEQIINNRIKEEKESWQKLLINIAGSSPQDIAVLDLNKKEISENGNIVYVEDDLIDKLRFVKEGQFVDSGGDPTLVLKGEIRGASFLNKQVPTHVDQFDLFNIFLKGSCEYPFEYLKTIIHQECKYIPLWFFVHKCGVPIEDLIEQLHNEESKSSYKHEIIQRLKEHSEAIDCSKIEKDHSFKRPKGKVNIKGINNYIEKQITDKKLKKNASVTRKRTVFWYFLSNFPEALDLESLQNYGDDLRILIQSIRNLNESTIFQYREFIFKILKFALGAELNTDLRKAFCHVDIMLYRSIALAESQLQGVSAKLDV
jgi:hypothetical protein